MKIFSETAGSLEKTSQQKRNWDPFRGTGKVMTDDRSFKSSRFIGSYVLWLSHGSKYGPEYDCEGIQSHYLSEHDSNERGKRPGPCASDWPRGGRLCETSGDSLPNSNPWRNSAW